MAVSSSMMQTAGKGGFSIFRFIKKNWYYIIMFFVILPMVITSIKTGVETGNYAYPFIELGVSIMNADAIIYDKVQTLKESPNDLIGEKPENGLWNKLKYYFNVGKLGWSFLGLVYLISFPFMIVHKIVLRKDESKKWKAIWTTAWITLLFMFIINLIFLLYKIGIGSETFTLLEGTSIFEGAWIIITWLFPFHGIVSLITYLFSLF